jgi:hypothetical protein
MHFGGDQEGIESSFSEEKEAKRSKKTFVCLQDPALLGAGTNGRRFFGSFFKKEHRFLPSALAMHHASS